MPDLIDRLDKWLSANRPDYYAGLAPGISEDQVEACEQGYIEDGDYGMEPTEEFDALYERINPGYPKENKSG